MTNPLQGMPLGRPATPDASRRFGTITAASPLRVQLDGEDAPLDADPISLVSGLRAGDRVRVEIHNRQVILTGRIQPATGWQTLILGNGWTPFGQGYAQLRVKRVADGARLDGVASPGTAGSWPAVFAVLPQWAWPLYPKLIHVGAWTNQTAVYRLNVATNGQLSMTGLTDQPSYVMFDNVVITLD